MTVGGQTGKDTDRTKGLGGDSSIIGHKDQSFKRQKSERSAAVLKLKRMNIRES
jgi:hypothetical protein